MNGIKLAEQQLGHKIIDELFEAEVHDMGGGLRIVSMRKGWLTVEARDLIVRAIQNYIR